MAGRSLLGMLVALLGLAPQRPQRADKPEIMLRIDASTTRFKEAAEAARDSVRRFELARTPMERRNRWEPVKEAVAMRATLPAAREERNGWRPRLDLGRMLDVDFAGGKRRARRLRHRAGAARRAAASSP